MKKCNLDKFLTIRVYTLQRRLSAKEVPMNTPPHPERRKFPRVPTSASLHYSQASQPEWSSMEQQIAQTKNLSPMGLCFTAANPVSPGTILRLSLDLPEFSDELSGLGRVIWCHPESDSPGYQIGLEFIAVSSNRVSPALHKLAESLMAAYESE